MLDVMVSSTWNEREAVLLEALAELEAEGAVGDSSNVAERTGLSGPDVGYGLLALSEAVPPFVVISGGDQGSIADRVPYYVNVRLGERGRREVGAWPSEENALEGFLELLTQRIEAEDDEEEKSRLEELREAARDVGAPVLGGLLLTYVKSWVGMA